ncbi:hypothetical protein HUA74_44360 [Myxococcus sp. CA051A]|nr:MULTISPECIES: hypothetical protein [unclassified Myxococcus]NTX17293.1 hypothetical protein [Myxococcus sp. CA056]NTX67703.1 hypothetical protein [Myxococcus sp. CA051A]
MTRLCRYLLTTSLSVLGLTACGNVAPPDEVQSSTRQDEVVAEAVPLPLPLGCLLTSLDTDQDGVCDIVEVVFGTNPNNADTDGDRLSDYVELFGFGGVDLSALGANPRKKDIFVEVDYLPGLLPTQDTLNSVITAFAKAPVSNPNGSTGITLHLVVSQEIAAADVDLDLSPVWTDFDTIKAKYFAASRAPYFHYMLFAHRYNGGNSSGISRGLPAQDFVVSLGFWGGVPNVAVAGTLMHELGHNIGLDHGGNDGANYKPNYLSIMNYEYQFHGFVIDNIGGVLDYSRVRVAAFSEQNILETSAFAPIAPTTEADLDRIGGVRVNGVNIFGHAGNFLDFNNNVQVDNGAYSLDFNRNGFAGDVFPAAQNDWLALIYDGGGQIGFATPGISRHLDREAPFLVTPEKMEPCLTVDLARAP